MRALMRERFNHLSLKGCWDSCSRSAQDISAERKCLTVCRVPCSCLRVLRDRCLANMAQGDALRASAHEQESCCAKVCASVRHKL